MSRSDLAPPELVSRVRELLAAAQRACPHDASRVALATADATGRPSVRYVLLKDYDERGFVFYTNYGSRKAQSMAANPQAALAFHWWETGTQIRAEGPVEQVSPAESDAYFATRHRSSQLGAWASDQSRPLESRDVLLARLAEVTARFEGREVPRPDDWGGFLLRPERVEIWHDRPDRLHERVEYRPGPEGWTPQRLNP